MFRVRDASSSINFYPLSPIFSTLFPSWRIL